MNYGWENNLWLLLTERAKWLNPNTMTENEYWERGPKPKMKSDEVEIHALAKSCRSVYITSLMPIPAELTN